MNIIYILLLKIKNFKIDDLSGTNECVNAYLSTLNYYLNYPNILRGIAIISYSSVFN